jgi:hypothetical protein
MLNKASFKPVAHLLTTLTQLQFNRRDAQGNCRSAYAPRSKERDKFLAELDAKYVASVAALQQIERSIGSGPDAPIVFRLSDDDILIDRGRDIICNINPDDYHFSPAPGQTSEEFNRLHSGLLAICAERDRRKVEAMERGKRRQQRREVMELIDNR